MQHDRPEEFVGLDVHKDSITAAVSEGGQLEAARDLGRIAHDLPRLLKLLARVGAPEELHVCYEAGPTGYGLCRALRAHGIDCIVVAPSKTPQPPGGRIRTDRRDRARTRRLRVGDRAAAAPQGRVSAARPRTPTPSTTNEEPRGR